ncbi:MAG: hypothetical protein ABMB14_08860 [Myxococcota bacterium]
MTLIGLLALPRPAGACDGPGWAPPPTTVWCGSEPGCERWFPTAETGDRVVEDAGGAWVATWGDRWSLWRVDADGRRLIHRADPAQIQGPTGVGVFAEIESILPTPDGTRLYAIARYAAPDELYESRWWELWAFEAGARRDLGLRSTAPMLGWVLTDGAVVVLADGDLHRVEPGARVRLGTGGATTRPDERTPWLVTPGERTTAVCPSRPGTIAVDTGSVADWRVAADDTLLYRSADDWLAVALRDGAVPRTVVSDLPPGAPIELEPGGRHALTFTRFEGTWDWVWAGDLAEAGTLLTFMANYDGPRPVSGGVTADLLRVGVTDGRIERLGCRSSAVWPAPLAAFDQVCDDPFGERARARLDALRLPKLPECASLEQAFVYCSAAIRKADRTGYVRCVDRADDVDLAVRRREILTALWASDPEVEALGPTGVVSYRGPWGEREMVFDRHGCSWKLAPR